MSNTVSWYDELSLPNQIGFLIGVVISGIIIVVGIIHYSKKAAEKTHHVL
jgi:urea transporter